MRRLNRYQIARSWLEWRVRGGLLLLLLVVRSRQALAVDCTTAPRIGEVIIYKDGNRRGSCSRLNASTGRYWVDQSFGLPNDSISSIWVGQKTRVDLYRDGWISGPAAHYEGSPWTSDWWYNVLNNDDASSIVVSLTDGVLTPFWFVGNYPNNTDNPAWAEDAQGVAHSADSWYFTQRTNVWRYPLGADLGKTQGTSGRMGFDTLWLMNDFAWIPAAGYDHFGDPDFRNGYLFVPVEHSAPGSLPIVLILDATLKPVAWDYLGNAKPDADGKYNAAWVSVSSTGLLYTSGGRLDQSHGIQTYQVDFSAIPYNGYVTTFMKEQILYHYQPAVPDGPPASMYIGSATGPLLPASVAQIQGGDLVDWDENLIYISNGCCQDTSGAQPYAVRAYDLRTGIQQVESSNGYGPFNFAFESLVFWTTQEPEGIDFYDIPANTSPGIPASQLHVILYNNVPTTSFTHDVWLKHYSW
ncbi:MAG TPA: hypothetical protein VHM31_20565 [Polyangia bacterium]|nr:hypothetical protein [Polyangia bacterium]